jgi:hypothetical protein
MLASRPLVELLEQQRSLWLQLAVSIEQAQIALLGGDVALLERSTEEQARFCSQLVALCPPVLERTNGWPQTSPPAFSPTTGAAPLRRPGKDRARDLDPLVEEIRCVRKRVRHLARVHAALLRRASRSVCILRNLLEGPKITYSSLDLLQPGATSRFGE